LNLIRVMPAKGLDVMNIPPLSETRLAPAACTVGAGIVIR